jgi:hypothetical protein
MQERNPKLLMAFSKLTSDSSRDSFVKQYPEIKNPIYATDALSVAKSARANNDIPMAWMYSIAAFYLGGEIHDHLLGAEASDLAAELAPLTGNDHLTQSSKLAAMALRAEVASRPSLGIHPALTMSVALIRKSYPDAEVCMRQVNVAVSQIDDLPTLIQALSSQDPGVVCLSLLCIAKFHWDGKDILQAVQPIRRLIAIFQGNNNDIENGAWMVLALVGDPFSQAVKQMVMMKYNKTKESEFAIASIAELLLYIGKPMN